MDWKTSTLPCVLFSALLCRLYDQSGIFFGGGGSIKEKRKGKEGKPDHPMQCGDGDGDGDDDGNGDDDDDYDHHRDCYPASSS